MFDSGNENRCPLCRLSPYLKSMEITPDTAFAAAQIIAVLLVATMLDPWAKNSARAGKHGASRWRRIGAMVTYFAKVITVIVLLFDMQIVLFASEWHGTRGMLLALGNYFAVVACALSILLAVLAHIGAFEESAE